MNYDTEKAIRVKIREISYYLVIAIVSIISLLIIPLLNSNADFDFPTTKWEWIQWAVTRGCIVACNLLFYFCFMQQAKVNVKNDEKYIEANVILSNSKIIKEINPKSPKRWTAKQYGSKGFTLILSSAISTITLTNAILNFDLVAFLSDLFTIGMGLVFGYIQMRKAEDYWTEEYWLYAKLKEKEIIENDNRGQQSLPQSSRTSSEE